MPQQMTSESVFEFSIVQAVQIGRNEMKNSSSWSSFVRSDLLLFLLGLVGLMILLPVPLRGRGSTIQRLLHFLAKPSTNTKIEVRPKALLTPFVFITSRDRCIKMAPGLGFMDFPSSAFCLNGIAARPSFSSLFSITKNHYLVYVPWDCAILTSMSISGWFRT